MNQDLSEKRSKAVKKAIPEGANQWSAYPQEKLASPSEVQEQKK